MLAPEDRDILFIYRADMHDKTSRDLPANFVKYRHMYIPKIERDMQMSSHIPQISSNIRSVDKIWGSEDVDFVYGSSLHDKTDAIGKKSKPKSELIEENMFSTKNRLMKQKGKRKAAFLI